MIISQDEFRALLVLWTALRHYHEAWYIPFTSTPTSLPFVVVR